MVAEAAKCCTGCWWGGWCIYQRFYRTSLVFNAECVGLLKWESLVSSTL